MFLRYKVLDEEVYINAPSIHKVFNVKSGTGYIECITVHTSHIYKYTYACFYIFAL